MAGMLVVLLVLGTPAAAAPSGAAPARVVDPARISRAFNAMRPLGREARMGPWRLLTDAATGELAGLDAVAGNLADAFKTRYGLAAAPGPGEVVAIFASDTRYRTFAAGDGDAAPGVRGHAREGLAALVTGRNALETRVALVHELTRLLSRNALGEDLPAWLDHGLAEDLAWCRVDAAGRLEPDTLDVSQEARRGAPAGVLTASGPRATVDAWLKGARVGRIPPLSTVLSPLSPLFADTGARRDAATQSAMLIRWCLAEPARAAAFRGFLASVARGGPGDLNALAAALGTGTGELQKNFFEWLRTL